MTSFVPVNLWGAAAAVLAAWVLAALWYSPLLFMRPWAAMAGIDTAKFAARLPRAITVDLVSFVIMSLILDQALRVWGAQTITSSILCTFLLWLGFVAAVLVHSVSSTVCATTPSMRAIGWSACWR
jgi:hypothetical protein